MSPSAAIPVPGPLDLMFRQAAVAPSTRAASANVGAVLHLRGRAPSLATLRTHIASRSMDLKCLTHFLVQAEEGIVWDCANPDVDWHVVEQAVPEGHRQLEIVVESLRLTSLPVDRPAWRLFLLHGYSPDNYALFFLTQHDIQDAANIVTVLEQWFAAKVPLEQSSAAVHSLCDAEPSTESDYMGTLDELVRCTSSHGIWRNVGTGLRRERLVYWLHMPTELLRNGARSLNCSVNDIHLAAMGWAIADWAAEHWAPADGQPVPIMVPINLRSRIDLGSPGNKFFLGRVNVPGGTMTPRQRLQGTMESTAPLKSAAHRAALSRALNVLPRPLLDIITAASSTPEHLSVVGSIFSMRHPLRLGSDVVERVDPLICCPDGFPATVALFLYEENSSVCFHLDAALPAVDSIPERWRSAIDQISSATSVSPESEHPKGWQP